MNYSQIRKYDVSNGIGIRSSIFVTYCPHHCPHCFNSDIWDKHSGKPFEGKDKELLFSYLNDEHVSGLSVLGGEPLAQGEDMLELIQEVKETFPNKNIWLWTGYYIDGREPLNCIQKAIINLCDYVVDGRFINELKDPSLVFRGSSNQTIYRRDKENGEWIRDELNDKHLKKKE